METDKVQESNGQEAPEHGPEDVSETDAWKFSLPGRREDNALPSATDSSPVPAKGSGCERDAEEYNMSHPRRGVALIFNHQFFDRLSARSGSSKDCYNLSDQLRLLGFEIQIHNDLSYSQLSGVLNEMARKDHSSADCLLVAVMSHGEPGLLYSRDRKYPATHLWSYFTGDKCHSLIGKPKLFFIQACRGEKVDPGASVDDTDGYSMSYTIPIEADILVAYSTPEGYYSWRNPSQGSWFIQALCEELRLHGRTRDLMTLLTFVCRRVAIDYCSNVPGNEEMDLRKQIPSITTMLTRLVYFR